MRVPTVDDDVSFIKKRNDRLNDFIDRLSGRDHQHDLSRPFKRRDQFLNGRTSVNLLPMPSAKDKFFKLFLGNIKD